MMSTRVTMTVFTLVEVFFIKPAVGRVVFAIRWVARGPGDLSLRLVVVFHGRMWFDPRQSSPGRTCQSPGRAGP